MVYRGKPSAGCEACRKAKKRCGLEQPACLRCVKLKKNCSGYRDTTQLQIQDESETVKLKAERQKQKVTPTPPPSSSPSKRATPEPFAVLTPHSMGNSSSSGSSDDTIEMDMLDVDNDGLIGPEQVMGGMGMGVVSLGVGLTIPIRPKPDDIATNYFYSQFTSNGHWEFVRGYAMQRTMDPCLELAIKACGMAALGNIQHIPMGKDYSRNMYVEALSLLNGALRDPKRSKTDESLVAVAMLGYYENLTCEGTVSIHSWKAHIMGATQLLQLRGKEQFKTQVGRLLFRETRAQILIKCIWDDEVPPAFILDYQDELELQTVDPAVAKQADEMVRMCFDFAVIRARIRKNEFTNAEAAELLSSLERDFIQWSIDTTLDGAERWRFYEIEVADSEHVWDGKVHAYTGHPAPSVWNTWRSMRIMLSRTQEMVCNRFAFAEAEREQQLRYFRKVRRQMTDEICAGVPPCLGHAAPAYNSPCVLITAYGSIWPLFFAAGCALERMGAGALPILRGEPTPPQRTSAASTQALWIMGRLDYISREIGLKWADGINSTLKGEYFVDQDFDDDPVHSWLQKVNGGQGKWLSWVAEARDGATKSLVDSDPNTKPLAEPVQPAAIKDHNWSWH